MSSVRVPRALYTAAQVRELDRCAIEDCGIDGYALMQRAGAAAFRLLRLRWPGARRIAVFCGGGNNGGDGLVIARLARAAGLEAVVGLGREPAALAGAAARAWADWAADGGGAHALAAVDPGAVDVVVDALLGTGLDRAVRGSVAEAIARINEAGRPTLAVDLPSGLQADTGTVLGDAVRAAATISFIGAKRGLYTADAPEHTGPVFLDDLDVPPAVFADAGAVVRYLGDAADVPPVPQRRPCAHKGEAGHVLIAGGNHGYAGAARMAGETALRCGAGLVSVATRAAHAPALAAARPELMAHGIEDPAQALPLLLERASVIAIGPGLGRDGWARAALRRVLGAQKRPRVLDADALNLLAEHSGAVHLEPTDVITPHPGEAARLLDTETAEVQADRFAAVSALRARLGCTVVLKGAGTVIAPADGGALDLLPQALGAMAVGGMGDVLTGVIAALMGQGLASADAARLGVWLHAAAATRLARAGQGPTVLPGELGAAIASLQAHAD